MSQETKLHVDTGISRNRPVILVVDDEEPLLRVISRELSSVPVDVVTSSSPMEALGLLETREFDVVVSDLRMPGMDGIAFLEQVRQRSPNTQRILISAYAEMHDAVQVINRVGLFSFTTKPWEPGDLREVVLRAARQHQILVENEKLTGEIRVKNTELEDLTRNLEIEVQSRTTSLLLGMVNALDLRDTETHWHSRRVALFARRLAEELDIGGDALLHIERGSLLHDVGKIGVSDTILLKPGKLTDEEWVEMRKHSEYGYRILEKIEFLGDARLLVWQHHERWDGKGYPNGLAGEEIHIGARIFAVIDTYDAMTSDRPYRKALPHETALEEISRNVGSQFDPKVVEAWQRIEQDGLQRLRSRVEEEHAGLD
ncbi:MAG TPA: HD domain-containing phosphohydrolase [Polyangia bacterium]|nr:HD domain-containing phosphohydrolase [Polyangia bacterium]